jgi:hypothetical protein
MVELILFPLVVAAMACAVSKATRRRHETRWRAMEARWRRY